ncbi:MAG: hypothetical protein ACFE0Q_04140 [Anaerolineae bacterium]
MHPDLYQKLQSAPGKVILRLNPIFEKLPLNILRYDDPFLPFSKAVIPATQDIVAGYLFDFASYLAMGGAGAVALERSIALVPSDCMTLLHGPFLGAAYSLMAGKTGFDVDMISVSTTQDQAHYSTQPPYSACLITTQSVLSDTNCYYQTVEQVIYYRENRWSVTTDAVLYASKMDNFVDKLREGILAL